MRRTRYVARPFVSARGFSGVFIVRSSVDYLLYEELPRHPVAQTPARLPALLREAPAPATIAETWPVPANRPALTVLSNGHLSTAVTNRGGGGTTWNGLSVTRWRPDIQGTAGGNVLYLKDLESDTLWGIGASSSDASTMTARFGPHIAELTDHRHAVLVRAQMFVAPHTDVEIRQLTLTNESDRPRRPGIRRPCHSSAGWVV